MSRQVAWDVYRPHKNLSDRWVFWDTVYFTPYCDEKYVKDSLVNHDGYPCDIKVVSR